MKKIFCLLGLVLLSLLLASCGKNAKTSESTASLQKFRDLDALNAALDKQRVYCGVEGAKCPGYAAKLTYWFEAEDSNYYLGTCSGTLYQNRYIITNSHCIPDEIKNAGSSCSDQLKVLFPYTNRFVSEEVRCSRIIQVYDQKNGGPDIAVLEIEQNIYRDEVKISKNAFIDNSKVYAYTMNPSTTDKTVGTITQKKCTLSIDNAFFMSTLASSHGAILNGHDCDVIHGNSGSGLFNEAGEYIGAVFAKVEMTALYEIFSKNKIYHTMIGPNGIVQNIGCLNSITSNAGVGCSMKMKTSLELENYLLRMKQKVKLETENESLINYEMQNGFQLKLTKVDSYNANRSLDSFRKTWNEIFTEKANAIDSLNKIILKL